MNRGVQVSVFGESGVSRGRRRWVSAVAVAVSAAGLVAAGGGVASADATVSSWSELTAAFAAGGTVTLSADISNPSGQHLVVDPSSPVTLDLNGNSLTVDVSSTNMLAAISVPPGASFTVEDSNPGASNALEADGGDGAAGIGGDAAATANDPAPGAGSVTINSGTVTATGGRSGAGIGGGSYPDGLCFQGNEVSGGTSIESVTISGGTVTATGGTYGAGIGSSDCSAPAPGPVSVSGGTVSAAGGTEAAGVSGGYFGNGGTVSVTGGQLQATGGLAAAGVGGGDGVGGGGSGGAVTVGPAGALTAVDGGGGASAVGAGRNGANFGSLSNAGSVTIPSGSTLVIPAGVTVDNSDMLSGAGTVHNLGAIDLHGTGSVDAALTVDTNNYTLDFDVNGGSGTAPDPLQVYAGTVTASGQSLPAGPSRPGSSFAGWFTAASGGMRVGNGTDLNALFGNGPVSQTLYAQYTAVAPTVSGVSPSSGSTAGGQSVTVTGSNFTDATGVYFGSVGATSVNVVSDSQLTVVAPAHAAGLVNVYVRGPGGQSAAVRADHYLYAAPPTVTGVSPAVGPLRGGDQVVITGTGFNATTAVSFGATASTSVTLVSSTQLKARVPAGTAGTVDVTVTARGGPSATHSADQYTYLGRPVVTSVSPDSGSTSGGNTITVTGTGLSYVSTVRFAGTTVTFTAVSDTKLTFTAPAHAKGVVYVNVTSPGGTSTSGTNSRYRYVN